MSTKWGLAVLWYRRSIERSPADQLAYMQHFRHLLHQYNQTHGTNLSSADLERYLSEWIRTEENPPEESKKGEIGRGRRKRRKLFGSGRKKHVVFIL